MFDDEDPFNFKKMLGLSTVDGFTEVSECLSDMIKFVANEPSAGLYYIQQHIQNSAPHLIKLDNNVTEKSHDTSLHTEDIEDSISMVRSMREYGYVIADDMVKDISTSLAIIATKNPKKGLIKSSNSTWGPSTWGLSSSSSQQDDDVGNSSYLSSVMRSTKLGNFGWGRAELEDSGQEKDRSDDESSELRSSNEVIDELKVMESDQSMSKDDYDELKAIKEAKLQEWLGD